MTTTDEAPIPYRPVRRTRRGLSPRGKAAVTYATFFIVALSIFGAMILLSLI